MLARARAAAGAPGQAYAGGVPFTEVSDRVWVAPQAWCDVNVAVVGGEAGLVVVDTSGSTAAAAPVVEEVAGLPGEVVAVVTTHWHFDHTFGTAAFRDRWPAVPVHAHEAAAQELARWGEQTRRDGAADPDEPHAGELAATTLVPPDRLFSAVAVVDLGDRLVELVHPGAGHTGGDLVVRVGDADVVLAGDLVEQSDRREDRSVGGLAVPGLGPDCHPLAWPSTLDVVLDLLTSSTVVVPGHGRVVDRDHVEQQRNELGLLAQGVRDQAASGAGPQEALARGEWPYPRHLLGDAVERGYAALPRGGRRLPLA